MSSWTRGAVTSAVLPLLPVLLLLSACSPGPVEIQAPRLSSADAAACRTLVRDLPDRLDGHDRVATSGDTQYGAAWGDPAIVLTCGVGRPAGFTATSSCITMNRTGWFVPDRVLLSKDETLDVRTTELNYRPRVELFIPGGYRPDGFTNGIGEIGRIIEHDLRRTGHCR